MKMISRLALGLLAVGMTCSLLACDSMYVFTNSDAALRKSPTQFAADAAKRHYEADALTTEDSGARAQYDLTIRSINITNLTDSDWSDAEIWVNHQYVVYLPSFEGRTDKTISFGMFFDQSGNKFDTEGGRNPLKSLEIFRDGKMYSVPFSLTE
ncbi:MAG TPA: hypothetical protein VMD30_06880 [Tepidisphaeraceae bacterium]|nr:hypothetical protein [Tepidisphaeraceae bacterium]